MSQILRNRAVLVGVDLLLVAAAVVDVFDTPVSALARWCALAAAAALVLRRRWPLAVFLVTLPGLASGAALIAALVALFTVARRVSRWWIAVPCGVAVFCLVLFVKPEDPHGAVVFSVVYAVLFAVAPLALGRLAAARAQLRAQIEQLTELREQEVAQQAALLLSRERARLASEMHDVVSHQVSLIAVRAGALQVSDADEGARTAGADIRALAVTTLTELRGMVNLLRASGVDRAKLVPQPLFRDVPQLVEGSGLPVDARLDFPDGVSSAVQRAVYRCIQEGLTNARKHAPGARIEVVVGEEGDSTVVRVTTGRPERAPLDLPGTGSGLTGLRERAESLGGSFSAGVVADGSHMVEMRLPTAPR